jgi:hypothetical protein
MKIVKFILCLFLITLKESKGFSQNNILFEGLVIHRSSTYPLMKVKTHLNKIQPWQDSLLKLDTHTDSLASLSSFSKYLSLNSKTLVFNHISYLNALHWTFKNESDSDLWLFEIHFDNPQDHKKALFMMNKNLPKYQLEMVGSSYYKWLSIENNIYLIRIFHNEGSESDIDYLEITEQKIKAIFE